MKIEEAINPSRNKDAAKEFAADTIKYLLSEVVLKDLFPPSQERLEEVNDLLRIALCSFARGVMEANIECHK